EYARRGFGELTVVVTLATLLVLALDRHALRGPLDGRVRLLELALVLELELLLVSAFRRVWLYETAYGFTTARLYAQTYMIALAPLLVLLARDALRGRHEWPRCSRSLSLPTATTRRGSRSGTSRGTARPDSSTSRTSCGRSHSTGCRSSS